MSPLLFNRKKIIVAHDGDFHADDVCAVAVLSILYNGRIRVIRTRDEKLFGIADIVLDVGGQHDGVRFFDHHQVGGAGERSNGIPYASFGLIWKAFGKMVAGSAEVAKRFDEEFVQSVDAGDNGVETFTKGPSGVAPVTLSYLVRLLNPTWHHNRDEEKDAAFLRTVALVKTLIEQVLAQYRAIEEARDLVMSDIERAALADKRIIELHGEYPWMDVVIREAPEALFVVYKRANGNWSAKAIPKGEREYAVRKPFPVEWAGKRDKELADISGVSDALFCHRALFMVVAHSREGALALAHKALAQ
jgi:uncharacterized UPF0160 family protein